MSEDKVFDSKPSEVEKEPVELEGLFLLRLPPPAATSLRLTLKSGGLNLEKRLKIRIEEDMKNCSVTYDGWSLTGKIVDLPTIIEAVKTLDKKVFYKAGDICQMMICEDADEKEVLGEEPKTEKDKSYPHGITAPMKNVRKTRFRKTLKKKSIDVPDYEREVKRLFKQDLDAISVRYELVSEEEDKQNKSEASNSNGSQVAEIDEADLFGEISCGSEDSERDYEEEEEETVNLSSELANNLVDINGLDRPDCETETVADELEVPNGMADGLEEPNGMADGLEVPNDIADDLEVPNGIDDEMENVSKLQLELETAGENLGHLLLEQMMEDEKAQLCEKIKELEHHISSLQSKERELQFQMSTMENESLRERFQSNIESLKQEIYEKQTECNEIRTILQEN